jgi:long-chain fatty acid transport protein
VAALLAIGRVAHADPSDSFGFGARGPALGNAMVASDDALSSPVYNAAAGSLATKVEIGVGYQYADLALELDERDAELMNAHGGWGALLVPFGVGDVRAALGLAAYVPDQFILRLYSVPATEPRFVMWDNQPHRLVMNFALSARVAELVAVGVGVTLLGGAEGEVAFALGSRGSRLVSEAAIDSRLPMHYAPLVGLLVTPASTIRIGVRYTEPIAADVQLDANADVDIEGTALEGTSLVRTVGQNYFTPREAALGAGIDLQAWTFSAEVTWQQWSSLARVSYAVELDVDLGVDTPVFGFAEPEPKWRDIVSPHVGVERRIELDAERRLSLRAGWWYAPSPVPDQTGLTSFADSDRHIFTAGAGFRFEDLGVPVTAEVAGQAHVLDERELRKQSVADPGGSHVIDGRVLVISFGLRAEL